MPKYQIIRYYLRCNCCSKKSEEYEQFTPEGWYLSEYGRAVCPECLKAT